MALFAKSVQATHSHSGFKPLFNIRSLIFCCSKTEDELHSEEKIIPSDESMEKDTVTKVNDIPLDEEASNVPGDLATDKTDEGDEEAINLGKEQCDRDNSLLNEDIAENANHVENENCGIDTQEIIADEEIKEDYPEQVLKQGQEEEEIFDSHSITEEFDNISEHELNISATDEKIEKVKTGDLRLKIGFESEKGSLIMTIVEAHDFARPSSSTHSIKEHVTTDVPPVLAYSVHVLVVQLKKHRYKTKMRQGPDPFFDEIIKITKITKDEAKKWFLRFRLYGSLRNSMKQIIGEGFLPLQDIDIDKRMQCDIALMTHDPRITEDRMNTLMYASHVKAESSSSLNSLEKNSSFLEIGATPELSVGLAFNLNTGRLTIDIKKGNKFPKLKDHKLPDSFIRIKLIGANGEEMFNAKSAIRKSNCEPEFDETFVFQVFMFQLDDITLLIEGYQKLKLGKKLHFGTIKIGKESVQEEGKTHWKDLVTSAAGEQIIRWHNFELHPV